MKEMSPEDKQRIEKEAEHWMQNLDPLKMHPYHGYVTGATAEHERMAELLKEEKNKAIDDVIRKLDSEYVERGDIVAPWKNIKYDIESLKGKSQ